MTRFVHLLAFLALLFAPPAMHRADAATAAPHHQTAAPAGHCDGSGQVPADESGGQAADCALACSAMPGACAALAVSPAPRSAYALGRAAFFAGTVPGSDPPPPRAS